MMMKKVFVLLLIAAGLVSFSISCRHDFAEEYRITMVTLKETCPPGTVLTAEMLESVDVVPAGNLGIPWEKRSSLYGKKLRQAVFAGDPVKWSDLELKQSSYRNYKVERK